MTWLVVYGSVAVAMFAVLSLCFLRNLRDGAQRLPAVIAAAVLWPVMVVGLLQYGVVRALAAYLGRRSLTPTPVPVEAEPAMPILVDSLARVAQRMGGARPA